MATAQPINVDFMRLRGRLRAATKRSYTCIICNKKIKEDTIHADASNFSSAKPRAHLTCIYDALEQFPDDITERLEQYHRDNHRRGLGSKLPVLLMDVERVLEIEGADNIIGNGQHSAEGTGFEPQATGRVAVASTEDLDGQLDALASNGTVVVHPPEAADVEHIDDLPTVETVESPSSMAPIIEKGAENLVEHLVTRGGRHIRPGDAVMSQDFMSGRDARREIERRRDVHDWSNRAFDDLMAAATLDYEIVRGINPWTHRDGERLVVCYLRTGVGTAVGLAICGFDDVFDLGLGMQIARGRATYLLTGRVKVRRHGITTIDEPNPEPVRRFEAKVALMMCAKDLPKTVSRCGGKSFFTRSVTWRLPGMFAREVVTEEMVHAAP